MPFEESIIQLEIHMKNISFFLVFLLLLQSCSVYNRPATIDEAVVSEKKVKVFTTNNQKFKFRRLEHRDDRLVGISQRESSSSANLAGMSNTIDDKFLVTDLTNIAIEKIMLRNETASTNRTIIAVAATILLAVVANFIISFATAERGNFGI